jgi:DNA adenine methylase
MRTYEATDPASPALRFAIMTIIQMSENNGQSGGPRVTGTGIPVPPLLKWPGGKRLLMDHILPLIPKRFTTYVEPFVGGGAVFFALRPRAAILSDTDRALIECYSQVRDNPRDVIRALQRLRNSSDEYYRIRSSRPRTPATAAARLIYLTNLSFNGIYRLNFSGEFNVPYGRRHHLRPAPPIKVRNISAALKSATLVCADFEAVVARAGKGDVVYLDPPYTVAHSNNGFIRYNARLFSWRDQERLAASAHGASDRGAVVIISNADHPSVRELYRRFDVITVQRRSTIAAKPEDRKAVTECIFYSGAK